MTIEQMIERRKALVIEKDQAVATVNAIGGAIQMLDSIIDETQKESQPAPSPDGPVPQHEAVPVPEGAL